jgi:hypothetical protein
MASGIEMMLKSMGIDIEKVKKELEQKLGEMLAGLKTVAGNIDAKLLAIQQGQAELARQQKVCIEMMEEIRAWQMNQQAPAPPQNRPAPQLVAPPPPNPSQLSQQ